MGIFGDIPDQLPNDLMWESIETGLNALISRSYGASWWAKIEFPPLTIPDAVIINLMYAPHKLLVPKVIFSVTMPFVIPRWNNDATVVTELTGHLYAALANTIRLYIMGQRLPAVGLFDMTDAGFNPMATPITLAEFEAARSDAMRPAPVRSWKLDRLCSTIADKHSAAIMDGEGE